MSTRKTSNDTIVSTRTKRIAAMTKYVTNRKTEIPIDGTMLEPSQIVAIFQADLDNRAAVTAAMAAYKAALAGRGATEGRAQVTDEALKWWVLNRFGADSAEALEFGYAHRKTPVLSAADRANAVLLGKATRDARGTMGKKAKLKIKGTLVAPAAPAEPATLSVPAVATAAVLAPAATPAVTAPVAAAARVIHAPAAGGDA